MGNFHCIFRDILQDQTISFSKIQTFLLPICKTQIHYFLYENKKIG